MRVVLVGGLMEIHDLWPATRKNLGEIGEHGGLARFFYLGARMRELDLDCVSTELRGVPLFDAPHILHLFIG